MGTFLFVVLMLLVVLSLLWCHHHKKRKRRRPKVANELHTRSLHSINTGTLAAHRPLPQHPRNKTGNSTDNLEDVSYIYQDLANDHTSEGEMINDPADTISRPLHDIILHRDGEDISQCQDTTINAEKEQYTDMSGSVKKKKRDVKFVQSRDSSATENDVDGNGYMISNVSQRRPMSFEKEKTSDINSVQFFGQAISRDLSTHSRPADNASKFGVISEETPSTSDQSTPTREPPHVHEYSTIERNDKCDALPMCLNNSLYSVNIYSSKQREEQELDESGYLVLQA
ncbi:uncharacterized protein [Diadema setosum]|uniref:uncharacterized protein n=1 Tax=Diadema setosum TaxID=31175 RepID=UPI003B3A9A4C